MRKTIIFSILFTLGSTLLAQDTISIEACMDKTLSNYPLMRQPELDSKSLDLTIKNLKSNYLPQLSFEASASYQSETVSLEIDAPIPGLEFPEPPLDKYDVSLNLKQLIWDGGITAKMQHLEAIKYEMKQAGTENNLYKLKALVQQSYFGILVLEATAVQMKDSYEFLLSKKKSVNSAVTNGILTPDNIEALEAELLSIEQKIITVNADIVSAREVLYELTGDTVVITGQLAPPLIQDSLLETHTNKRPEEKIFNIEKQLADQKINVYSSCRMPKISAFAKGAYGNPGLNMFEDKWGPYFITGVMLQWDLYDRFKTKRKKQMAVIEKQAVQVKQDAFERQLNIKLSKQRAQIIKQKKLLSNDIKIVKLRESITRKAESRLDNGIITAVEFSEFVNKENNAKIQLKIRKLKIKDAEYGYTTLLNVN